MLEAFKKQTLQPDKIICWLSREEYGTTDVPEPLILFVQEGYIEIRWVNKNTYGHKRYEVFKEFNNCCIILIDDDIYYPKTYVQELYKASLKHPHNVINYYSVIETYIGCMNKWVEFTNKPTLKNTYLSGFTCFPPNVFPVGSFTYSEDRDRITANCDDSWIKSWLIKDDINTVGLHKWKGICNSIEGTIENGIWQENGKVINSIRVKVSKFAKCVKFLGIDNKVKQLHPQFDLERAAEFSLAQVKLVDQEE